MRNVIKFLVVLALVFAVVLWLAGLDGQMEIRHGEWWIGISLPAAIVLAVAAFLVLHGLLRLVGWLRGWPERRRVRRRLNDRALAEIALTRALVALAAGRPEAARLEVARAKNLAGATPQLLLLEAEAARTLGDEEAATRAFEELAGRADSRFLGLRGLLRQAEAREDWDAARQIAADAQSVEPKAEWLRAERSEVALRRRDWGEALALSNAEAPRASLTLAAAEQETDPLKARELERQAFMADPRFSPAVLAHARRLAADGSPRRSRSALQQGWDAAPHPDIAEAYLAGEEDRIRRVKMAEELTRRTPDHAESRLLRARICLEAGLTGRARQELNALRDSGQADRRAYDLLVELERAEHSPDAAREKEAAWLREASDAPMEPVWRCGHCGAEHNHWKPLCEACGTAGAISWSGVTR
ncbi:heme biosynthesis HemY N-terminal domain-containing protein [Roseococcus pinisoli]|uniref:Heme biosynthesis protein HemY n=1 Tax=Roseococcus pinisoli TaxID=2835040 RepID=A0ABS5QAB2_9PROT|nr:heme biosynthesis HemY N-terminal domain-containing protein [Roseococcus pinisoli]MBS7810644.1 heme biosynthesis protein HemY [Roseococcus pinisoli]